MPDLFPTPEPDRADQWQFSEVARVGPTTRSEPSICSGAPLRTYRENWPVGSNALAEDATDLQVPPQPLAPLLIEGPYVRVKWALPKDTTGAVEFTFSGRVRILAKGRGFSRDANEGEDPSPAARKVLDADYSTHSAWPNLPREVYADEFTLLDQEVGAPGEIWYYSAFYEDAVTGRWFLSQSNGLSRNWAYKNEVDPVTGEAVSRHGSVLFNALPRAVRRKDYEDADNASLRFLQAMGRLLDLTKDELDQELRRYDIDNVDAARLPYIDWLIGWPTNFELDEQQRRIETANAVAIWKSKGATGAIEFALQTLTGWDVELIQGFPWVLLASPPTHEATSPPEGYELAVSTVTATDPAEITTGTAHGWATGDAVVIQDHVGSDPDINGIRTITVTGADSFTLDGVAVTVAGAGGVVRNEADGDWAAAVGALPLQTTLDADLAVQLASPGSWLDRRCYTPSAEVVTGGAGTGQDWRNPNGVLIQLREIPGASKELPTTVIAKVLRFVDLLFAHYAAVSIAAWQTDVEAWDLFGADIFADIIVWYSAEAWDWVEEAAVVDEIPELAVFHTWPHPDYPLGSVTGSSEYRTPHTGFAYTGVLYSEETLTIMPQFVNLTNDQLVTFATPTVAVGQLAFDPAAYTGSRFFRFRATGWVGGVTGSKSVTVQLYDLDNAEFVAGAGLTFAGTAADDQESSALVVGAASGNLKDSLTLYEVRVTLTGAADVSDFGAVGAVDIKVT